MVKTPTPPPAPPTPPGPGGRSAAETIIASETMIEAGVTALRHCEYGDDPSEVVRDVFYAMIHAR